MNRILSANIRILALGSPHGADQLGWQVADRLRLESSAAYRVHALPTPWEILDHLGEDARIIVIDAAVLDDGTSRDGGASSIVTVEVTQLEGNPLHGVSSHGGSLADVVQLARNLGRRWKSLVIHAAVIDPAAAVPGHRVDADLVDELEQTVRRTLHEWMTPGDAERRPPQDVQDA